MKPESSLITDDIPWWTASQVAPVVRNPSANAGDARDMSSIPGSGRSLEKEMVTHSSVLPWKVSRTEEHGGLQFMRLQRAGHDWAHTLYTASGQYMCSCCYWAFWGIPWWSRHERLLVSSSTKTRRSWSYMVFPFSRTIFCDNHWHKPSVYAQHTDTWSAQLQRQCYYYGLTGVPSNGSHSNHQRATSHVYLSNHWTWLMFTIQLLPRVCFFLALIL